MCAQYTIKIKSKTLSEMFRAKLETEMDTENRRVMPYQTAPVVLERNGKRVMREFQFSLVPSWSKEKRVKFATHNARLLSFDEKAKKVVPIYEKPTWRGPFVTRHCLVPMSDFIEPIYSGDFAGNMVRFEPSSHALLVAAGLWEEWTSKETGEVVDSFTVITHDPVPFVEKIGHDRSPVFLSEADADTWLNPPTKDPKELVKFLMDRQLNPPLVVDKERALKAGWEKRA